MVRAMYRSVLVAVILVLASPLGGLAACAQTENDRPATLQYITEAILQPSCGQYTCHSSFRRAKDFAFDTVEAAAESLKKPGLVNTSDATASLLYVVLTR